MRCALLKISVVVVFLIVSSLCEATIAQMQQDGEFRVIDKYIKKRDVVFDGGAHVGHWSDHVLQATEKAVELYSFEPAPHTFEQLQRLLGSSAHSFMIAFANVDGYRDFFFYPGLAGPYHSSLFDWQRREKQKMSVRCRAIDSFCAEHGIEHVDFLKLDIEGAEFIALTGAKEMLEAQKIKFVQFEYNGEHPRANLKGIYALLSKCGYRIYKILPRRLQAVPRWSSRLETKRGCTNYLAVLADITV